MFLSRAGRAARLAVAAGLLVATGCLSPSLHRPPAGQDTAADIIRAAPPSDQPTGKDEDKGNAKDKGDGNSKEGDAKPKDEPKEPPKTIFEWSDGLCGVFAKNGSSANGDGQDKAGEKEKPLDTDRPDFGAATTTVGLGRAILETGYTAYLNHSPGTRFTGQTLPDAVLRVGLFADWFEFRIGESYARFKTTTTDGGVPATTTQNGLQDLYLGVKLGLTEQREFLPESVLILQSTAPTGPSSVTAHRFLPGAIYVYGWDIIEEKLDFGGLFEADKVVSDSGIPYVQMAQTLEVRYWFNSKFRTFLEWVALYPTAARTPGVGPEHYIHPGLTYFVTNDIQLDAHVFIGLNKHSVDFFGGPGLSIRY
jgi:hypothetical protein